MGVETICIAIVAALVYALAGYLKSAGENFDFVKFGATCAVGAVVGVILYGAGVPITEEAVLTQMAAYAGIVVVAENILKAIVKRMRGG